MAITLFLLFNVLCLWLLVKDFDVYKSFTMLVLSFYVYYTFSFVNYFFGANFQNFSENQVIMEFILLNTFMAGLILAKVFYGQEHKGDIRSAVTMKPPPYKTVLWAAYIFMAVGLIMYAAFIYLAYGGLAGLLRVTDRMELYNRKKGLGSLVIGLNLCFAGVLVRLSYYILFRKKVKQRFPVAAVLITTLLLGLQYFKGDRYNLILFALPFTMVLVYLHKRLNYAILIIIPFAFFFMQLIAVQRSLQHSSRRKVGLIKYLADKRNHKYMDITRFGEFTAPGKVDVVLCSHPDSFPIRYGGTYIDVLLNFAPKFVNKNRPMLPMEWYTYKFFPVTYRKGGGYGFSIIAESILNFYFFGPFVYGLLAGMLLLYMERRLIHGSYYYFLIYNGLMVYVFLISRTGIAGAIKPSLVTIILPYTLMRIASSLDDRRINRKKKATHRADSL